MNATTAAAIAQGLSALITLWRENANKPPGWQPTDEDWDALLTFNDFLSSDDYKRQAAELLGVPWPPEPPAS